MDAGKTSPCGSDDRLARIEAKLDILIAALAGEQEEDEPPALTLDGAAAGAPRDPGALL